MSALDWKMVRNGSARVERLVMGTHGLNESVQANLVVEDADGRLYSHLLSPAHSLSRALELQSPNQVSKRVNGGNFFVVNGTLVDYRTASDAKTFIHNDDSIATLIEKVGLRYNGVEPVDGDPDTLRSVVLQTGERALQPSEVSPLMAVAKKTTVRERLLTRDVSLSAFRDATELELEGFKEGGQFVSLVGQVWSPFKPHVEFTLGLVRAICANGMIGTRDELVQQFQIVNEWDRHLTIASQRFRDDVHRHVRERFSAMRDSRASLDNVVKAYEYVAKRVKAMERGNPEYVRATNLMSVLDTKYHLRDYYKEHVFTQGKLRGALPSHLTMFDLWNCVTEADGYLPEAKGSSSSSMQGFANELLLTDQRLHGVERMVGSHTLAPFSDPDQAFFGMLN